MSNLRTDYKDDVFTGSRKYHTINNPDGTVSFTDETEYEQNGDTYGAAQINEVNDIINNLDASAYRKTDGVENALADNDYLPFYDTSASASKKTAWSNIKSLLTQLLAIKVHNSNSAGTYGAGNASYFGHVKLSDNYASSAGNASQSVGASSQAVFSANSASVTRYNEITSELTANGNRIYMDYQNGRYGINTSAGRGAGSFIPFNDRVLVRVPFMTSDTGAATADSTYSTDYLPWMAFRATGGVGWGPRTDGEHWIMYHIPTPICPVMANIMGKGDLQWASDYQRLNAPAYFEASNDGVNWVIISNSFTEIGGNGSSGGPTYQFMTSSVPSTTYTYLRIRGGFTNTGGGYVIQFFGFYD